MTTKLVTLDKKVILSDQLACDIGVIQKKRVLYYNVFANALLTRTTLMVTLKLTKFISIVRTRIATQIRKLKMLKVDQCRIKH